MSEDIGVYSSTSSRLPGIASQISAIRNPIAHPYVSPYAPPEASTSPSEATTEASRPSLR